MTRFILRGIVVLTLVVLAMPVPDESRLLATMQIAKPPLDDTAEARLQLAARCGFDDWFHPLAEFTLEDSALLDRLITAQKFRELEQRSPGKLAAPSACDELSKDVERTPARPEWDAPECLPDCLILTEQPVNAGDSSIRFAVVGDVGEADDVGKPGTIQYSVATHIKDVCREASTPPAAACAFVLILGDNLYPSGVSDPDDERKLRQVVESYGMLSYLTLGNHDWHPARARASRAAGELAWIAKIANQIGVRGRAHFYDFVAGPVRLWGLDTNYLVRRSHELSAHKEELDLWTKKIETSTAKWKIAFGHHGYLSNGFHGNAGSFRDTLVVNWSGKEYRKFLEDHIVEDVDLMLSGHDHNLQFYSQSRSGQPNAALVISGAGSKCKGPGKRANRDKSGIYPQFEYYGHGFTIVTASATSLDVEMHSYADKWNVWRATKVAGAGWQTEADLVDTSTPTVCEG